MKVSLFQNKVAEIGQISCDLWMFGAEDRFVDFKGALEVPSRARKIAFALQQGAKIAKAGRSLRVIEAKRLLPYYEGTLEVRAGGNKIALSLQKKS
jgi:hypothetical protein